MCFDGVLRHSASEMFPAPLTFMFAVLATPLKETLPAPLTDALYAVALPPSTEIKPLPLTFASIDPSIPETLISPTADRSRKALYLASLNLRGTGDINNKISFSVTDDSFPYQFSNLDGCADGDFD